MDFECFKQRRFLVVGDIILDNYLSGTCSRISQEAPVPVVLLGKEINTLGGAVNVVANLRSLGCQVDVAGFVGDDYHGQYIFQLLDNLTVSSDNIVKCKELPTIVKTRIIANGQHVVRYDKESSFTNAGERLLFENDVQKLSDKFKYDAIIISDYCKGTITQSLMYVLKSFNVPILIDPKPVNSGLYYGCDFISPNMQEAKQMAAGESNPYAAAKYLKQLLGIKTVIVTMSENGVILSDSENYQFNIPAYHMQTDERHHRMDVVGAGDTMISTYAASVFSGFSQLQSVILANMAAAIVVNKLGTAVCTLDELKHEAINLESIENKYI